MQEKYDVVIIGGGIIGASIAYELSNKNLKILLLEKNSVFGGETTTGNSGVIHCGFDADTHKLEAHLNVVGNTMWQKQIFPKFKFPRQKVDSLVIAFNKKEMDHVHKLYQRGLDNGVKAQHLKILTHAELLKKEPNVNPKAMGALMCSNSYAIDPVAATNEFIAKAIKRGVTALTNAKVVSIAKQEKNLFQIHYGDKPYKALTKVIVNAAGHYADEIAAMAGYPDFKQTTKRGEYRYLDRSVNGIVNSICFMVPTLHGKGVIVAPTLAGFVLVGPTAEDGVAKADARLVTKKKFDLIGHIGTKIIPSLPMERTVMTVAGSRPIDIATNDFVIQSAHADKNFVNAAGMQSPGLSAAPAIAKAIYQLLKATDIAKKLK
ncbi:type 2 glycerol-3-phosphate oxidase [Candidatus Mycoplasma pogonae]